MYRYIYINANSVIHKLNPCLKLIFLFLIALIILFSHNIIEVALLSIFGIFLALISKISWEEVIKRIFSLKYLILFLFFANLFTKINIMDNLIMIMKIILILLYSYIYTVTTSPSETSYGIEKILLPYKKIIPVNKISLTINLSLRFIPIVADEAKRIYEAQKVRGVNYTKANLFDKIKIITNMIVPLLIISMNKSDLLADNIALRLYDLDTNRTSYQLYKIKKSDIISIIIVICLLIINLIY